MHGHTVVDDYAWMADRSDPRLRTYLEAENAYAAARTAHLNPLVERIVAELKGQHAPAHEQILLDENLEAGDGDFFALGASEVSPDGRLLAWSADRDGEERYDLIVRDIATGDILDDQVRRIGEGLAWSRDNRHVFYTRQDEAWRSHEIWRHELGTPAEADVLVLSEPDERFFLSVGATADECPASGRARSATRASASSSPKP